MSEKFDILEIEEAYKKLKHYFYFDNTSLFIRKSIADFESTGDIQAKLINLCKFLNQENSKTLSGLVKGISYKTTPKTIEKDTFDFVTNRIKKSPLRVNKVNIFINAAVELHIISALWLINAGIFLDKEIPAESYAYKLQMSTSEIETSDTKIVNGLRLYKPYFIQYQQWRDNAIEIAEDQLKRNNDVIILSLDVKDYFHSVRIDLDIIKSVLYNNNPHLKDNPKIEKLFHWLDKIHSQYTKVLSEILAIDIEHSKETPLPIGLLSSGLLGNLYLSQFDKKIKQELNPIYYGRYVDDILIVISNPVFNHVAISPVHTFLRQYFINKNLLSYKEPINEQLVTILEDDIQKLDPQFKSLSRPAKVTKANHKKDLNQVKGELDGLKYKLYDHLLIQGNKIKVQHFDKKESRAAINKFKKNLEKNRSEFRFLPEEESVNNEFDEEAFSIHYTDSINKLRSIKELSEDKYGASKFLAKKIFNSLYTQGGGDDKKTTQQILTFFKGEVAITFHTLWEKVATYFIINNQIKDLKTFVNQIKFSIDQLQDALTEDYKKDKKSITNSHFFVYVKECLNEYLDIAIALPCALDPENLGKQLRLRGNISDFAVSFRLSNMLRHNYVSIPLLNYTNYSQPRGKKYYSLLTSELESILNANAKLAIVDKKLIKYSPRFVHFHECTLLQIQKSVLEFNKFGHLYKTTTDSKGIIQATDCFSASVNDSFDIFWILNYKWKNIQNAERAKAEMRKRYYQIAFENDYIDWKVSSVTEQHKSSEIRGATFPNIRVAIANINVKKEDVTASYLNRPNNDKARRKMLFDLLNQAEKERSNLFVLPEVSIPHAWLKLLPHQSYRRNMAIVAGLEHWVNSKKFAFNFLVTVLPIKVDDYPTCLIKVRLKNHYSHEESRQLLGNRLKVPNNEPVRFFKNSKNQFIKENPEAQHLAKITLPARYDRFIWNDVYFSVYNCFELADIRDRCIFKSKVDFIVASEYNKDTAYFSDIATSWVRDVHCYFIQVNTSSYGDSRITRPSKSVMKDILQLKGGDNATILTGRLHINELREFQFVEYDIQKDWAEQKAEKFKPTPPDFDRKEVEKRIKRK